MGLLTDPSGLRGRPFQLVVNNHMKIAVVLYAASLGWFCLLASDQINAATYLSENALLPGLVVLESDVSKDARRYLKELESLSISNEEPEGLPTFWLRAKMTQMGVESYVHNFTLNYPLGVGQKYGGKNVYGIIRGGGSSNEGIVLSVPFRDIGSPFPDTKTSIALLLAIAKYFRKQKYWAKDIILLVTQHELLGTQAWLEAYHGASCGTKGVLDAGELPARSGSIQAALNLEIYSPKVEKLDIKVLGLNGQLPNLDLVNLVHRICSKERVRHSYASREKIHNLPPYEQWSRSFSTMLQTVLGQASSLPDGNHGLFHRFGIEAVTIEGKPSKILSNQDVSLYNIGRIIEGTFRSINNLLERFHQSYFFYILTDTDRFVSIALYIVCIVGLAAPLLLKAFSNQIKLRRSEPKSYNAGLVFTFVLFSFSLGLLSFRMPLLASRLPLTTPTSVMLGFSSLSLFGILAVELFVIYCGPREWTLLDISVLIYAATMLISVAMSNFSLAFVIAVPIVPTALISGTKLPSFIKSIIVLSCHPLVLTALAVHAIGAPLLTGIAEISVMTTVDAMVYGSSTLIYATVVYAPLWHMMFLLSRAISI